MWRYSRIEELDLGAYRPVGGAEGEGRDQGWFDPLLGSLGPRAGLLVLHNGRLAHAELDPQVAARGVTLGGMAAAPDGPQLLGSLAGAPDALVELSSAFVADPVLVRVPRGVTVEAPLVVVNWVDVEGGACFPRTFVQVAEGARASVVEVVASDQVGALVVPVAELDVADAGSLGYVGVQDLGQAAWQVGYQASRVARDAELVSFSVALGGHYARLRTDSRLAGPGGATKLLAAYFGDGDQMHDFRTMQDHDSPKTTSDLLFKGAVAGEARSVYTGLIRVRRGAVGTNAFQTNRNLVLSEGAHADSVPNLDIAENDVRCSHASAVGPVDPEQRYYLESRGIPPQVADRLIVLGFFDDIFERSPVPGLVPHLRRAVSAKLDRTAL